MLPHIMYSGVPLCQIVVVLKLGWFSECCDTGSWPIKGLPRDYTKSNKGEKI
jgi:hypothetical protein